MKTYYYKDHTRTHYRIVMEPIAVPSSAHTDYWLATLERAESESGRYSMVYRVAVECPKGEEPGLHTFIMDAGAYFAKVFTGMSRYVAEVYPDIAM